MNEEPEEDWELPKRPPFSFYDEAVRDEEMIDASPPLGNIRVSLSEPRQGEGFHSLVIEGSAAPLEVPTPFLWR